MQLRPVLVPAILLLPWLIGSSIAAAAPGDASQTASAEPIAHGQQIYNAHCLHCHGPNMVNPGTSSYDLRKFPSDGHDRFVDSVANGKNAMPPWKDSLTPEEIESVWAYVRTRGQS